MAERRLRIAVLLVAAGLVGSGVLLGPEILAQTGPDIAPGTEVILRGLPVNSFTRVGDVWEGRRDTLEALSTATIKRV